MWSPYICIVLTAILLLSDSFSNGAGAQTVPIHGCPRKEDIHPCNCQVLPTSKNESRRIRTLAFCKTIRNIQVLQDALKGMQGHTIDLIVLDSCKLPPFPNGLFHNIDIRWMEILNSTIQMKKEFFGCAKDCW